MYSILLGHQIEVHKSEDLYALWYHKLYIYIYIYITMYDTNILIDR